MTFLTKLLTFLTIFSQGVIIVAGVLFLLNRFTSWKFAKHYYQKLMYFIKDNALYLLFTVSVVAVSSSLTYSELGSFEPCKYCWLQRIFWFPQVLILGYGVFKQEKSAYNYSLLLAIVGFCIAVYHYTVQLISTYNPSDTPLTPCSAVGMTPSCSQFFFLEFGYITIPAMSVTGFALIILGVLVTKYYKQSN